MEFSLYVNGKTNFFDNLRNLKLYSLLKTHMTLRRAWPHPVINHDID
jgi:hypothetical protein